MVHQARLPQRVLNEAGYWYTAELRFSGATLRPAEITGRLGLPPSVTSDAWPERFRKARSPIWAYDGHGLDGYQYEWLSLEDGLRYVLACLAPVRNAVVEVGREFNGVWGCRLFQSRFDATTRLPGSLLAELGAYGMALVMDAYPCPPSPEFIPPVQAGGGQPGQDSYPSAACEASADVASELPHEYSVELRLSGPELVPSEITRRLGLQPSTTPDDWSEKCRKRRDPLWGYDGHDADGYRREWPSLEAGLWFLLRRLDPVRDVVVELGREFNGYWWCGHFQHDFCGGPELSAPLLAALSDYGLELILSTYPSLPEEYASLADAP